MKRKTPEDVWKNIDVGSENECWNWTGYTTNPGKGSGYGYITFSQESYVAHRVVYSLMNPGEISLRAPKNKSLREFVLHSCDNRLCCNPKHLFLGNYRDNNRDASRKGRSRSGAPQGAKHKLAKLNMKQVRKIRSLSKKGFSNEKLRKMYGISNEAARRVVIGLSYKE